MMHQKSLGRVTKSVRGHIIGNKGRNVQLIRKLTGVIVEITPGNIVWLFGKDRNSLDDVAVGLRLLVKKNTINKQKIMEIFATESNVDSANDEILAKAEEAVV